MGLRSWQQSISLHLTFQDRHVSRVIMEPHRIPAVRESACLHLIALQSSWPEAGCPNSIQVKKCLIIVYGGLLVSVKLEVSLWSASGQQLQRTRSSGAAKNLSSCHPSWYHIYVLLCFGYCPAPVLPLTLMWKKSYLLFLVLEATSVRQEGAVALIKNRATGFLQICRHTQSHTNTVTLQCFPLFQLSLI